MPFVGLGFTVRVRFVGGHSIVSTFWGMYNFNYITRKYKIIIGLNLAKLESPIAAQGDLITLPSSPQMLNLSLQSFYLSSASSTWVKLSF